MFKASAPGSLMILGEYAVLEGGYALVSAINKRLEVTFAPRKDHKIQINSSLGQLKTNIADLSIQSPFQFVLTVLKHYQSKLPSGCDINIRAEFSDQLGFASSAAVTVATLAAISEWLSLSLTKPELVQHARQFVREVQGVGSGADVAACVFGGVVFYKNEPLMMESLPHLFPIEVVYSGSKTKTVDAIAHVKKQFINTPEAYEKICNEINACVLQGKEAILNQKWSELGKIMNIQQGLMESLKVSTHTLDQIIQTLRAMPTILGAKISGAGLGDCVIGLSTNPLILRRVGKAQRAHHSHERWARYALPTLLFKSSLGDTITIDPEGVRCEKI